MVYENITEFKRSTKVSKSKIYRFYKKNEELFAETKLKNGKRLFPIGHIRYFDSEVMFDENKILRQENHSMRNLIDCLSDKKSLAHSLWEKEWSFFFTVAYKLERKKASCFKQMHGLYDFLLEKHGNSTELRLFFTTEPFTNRTGYHNHFVIHIENKRLYEQITDDIRDYFHYDRIDFSVYDRYKAGLFYMTKEGLSGEDWDILIDSNK
ncbi:hypothetical protein [Flavobacterium defluvii]|uniref:Uncharacterized protein n=1 Tax=Flavobacterium defluvii TaxID=370979 RepID=A0A1M5GCB4_9FLAO|nr:hypothetical protein [Flavobacterium defluvii]SHG01387.1 hypothetical protein SAMN05443663_101792 [Flavobacterium defluvii]